MCSRLATFGVLAVLSSGLPSCGAPNSAAPRYDPAQAVSGQFEGKNAYDWAMKIVAFGPRASGSAALEKTRAIFEVELAAMGWETQRQSFEEATPRGKIAFVNLRARFPGGDTWQRAVPLVVGSHYDTKFFPNLIFVGANDGASGNAVMLELARISATRPGLARNLELVFFDGEEATVNFTPTDGLHGSRHYQKFLRSLPARSRPRMALIFDMVGDSNLRIGIPPNSSRRLLALALQAASEAGTRAHFGIHPAEILDDHVPLAGAGLEVTNFIDLDYPSWHTSADTLDKISPESLAIAGRTATHLIEKYLLGQ
jgi:glutaminyl-peptide cyclotransferase